MKNFPDLSSLENWIEYGDFIVLISDSIAKSVRLLPSLAESNPFISRLAED